MWTTASLLLAASLCFPAALARPHVVVLRGTAAAPPPVVTTGQGKWKGAKSPLTNVEYFKGIPFAEPPIGQLRFAPPVPGTKQYGDFDATKFGYSCNQMNFLNGALPGQLGDFTEAVLDAITSLPIINQIASTNQSEDCLTLNVFRPAGTTASSKLPVMFWIYGGAFLIGGSSMYEAEGLVQRSINLNQPMIFVSANHRVNSLGFLPGRQVAADPSTSVNAGLLDQRLALKWCQDNIAAFGGDPTKVVAAGESSGAISIGFQMLINGGNNEGLFRGVILQSGAPVPVESEIRGQNSFDVIAKATGCYNVPDAIACLRAVPYPVLHHATNLLPNILSYQSVSLSFIPRTDGKILTAQAEDLLAAGAYSKVPVLTGNNKDEGTLLTLGTLNITTDAELRSWLSTVWFPNATQADISTMLVNYPRDPTQGSPFGTGYLNAITPQNKRISALIGDAVFQTGRRTFIQTLRNTQPVWSYLYTGFKKIPILGSFHLSDVLSLFGYVPLDPSAEMQTRWIAFVNNLDPNANNYITWPKYDAAQNIIQFNDDGPSTIIKDDYRATAMAYFSSIAARLAL